LVLVDGLQSDDLVVVGSSRHEHAAAFWLGSTPRSLIRHSPCPVVVVRGAATGGRPERIVVGVDGSDGALRALDWAGNEADRQHAQLLVVHGWTYPYIQLDSSTGRARDLTKVDAACTLDQAIERAVERFATAPTPCLVEASAPSALLETVRDGDLLVLGSRGRGALSSAIFGSTVNTVLEQSAVPVVVVPAIDESP
jgi:nucleotide-binding universal stress UspA family protein